MKTRYSLSIAALAAVLGALIVPALAQAPGGSGTMPDHGMGMGRAEHGMMSGGMMGGGCADMMQSMNGAGGRPNSQWHVHPNASPPKPD